MGTTKIKIISNPYQQAVSFQLWDDGWVPVDATTDPNSMLLSDDMAKGFFPFKAEEIVRTILEEYWVEGESLHIIFEGTDDEYADLRELCSINGLRDKVTLCRSSRTLLNASDVLPEVKRLVETLRDAMEVEKESYVDSLDLGRLFRVFDQSIPICIIGNYSSGKSTFINALIGCEVLPTGDEPITARIYQIRDSHDPTSASVGLDCQGERVLLQYDQNGLVCEDCDAPNFLLADICKALDDTRRPSLATHMNATLSHINGLDCVSDEIEIYVPFAGDEVWSDGHEFVIFDTPGSNSASNRDHARVLRKAMSGLSNGLPIYVAEYSTLDSTDNASLFDEIATIDALDERFAMIVVNKADTADIRLRDFDDEKRKLILDWAIPRSLYAQGIYFVSSLMGLGSKIGGDFISDSCAEKFEDQERKYSDPKSRFYKSLYRFNILPIPLGTRAVDEAKEYDDLMLANSGLYSVERGIETFADKYSAYNKCQLAQQAISEALELTRSSLENDMDSLKDIRDTQSRSLIAKASYLSKHLDSCAASISADVSNRYTLYAEKKTTCMRWLTSASKLQKRYAEPGSGPKEMLDRIQDGFRVAIESMAAIVCGNSRSFLEEEQREARNRLCSLALSDADMDENMKHGVTSLILDFPALDTTHIADVRFELSDYEWSFRLLFLNLGKSGELDYTKLATAYNDEIRSAFKQIVKMVRDNHKPRFSAWLNELCERITENIVEYNPELRDKQKLIDSIDTRLGHLTTSLEALDSCSQEISKLIEWSDDHNAD